MEAKSRKDKAESKTLSLQSFRSFVIAIRRLAKKQSPICRDALHKDLMIRNCRVALNGALIWLTRKDLISKYV